MTVFTATTKFCGENEKSFCQVKFIHTFWVSNGFIKFWIADNDRVYTITHNNDLEELFPGNKLLLESKLNELKLHGPFVFIIL